jgi:hypothetical protein
MDVEAARDLTHRLASVPAHGGRAALVQRQLRLTHRIMPTRHVVD